jgi:cell division transport system permease protein
MFKEGHKDDGPITQALNELTDNPLVASLNIKARQPDQYASIAQYLQAPNLSQYVDNLSYSKNEVVINRLVTMIHNVNRGGFFLTLILALIAGIVVFNTIRLAIYSMRDEIAVMRVVGASNSLVRGPFMVEGVIAGAFSTVLSLIIIAPFLYFASPYFKVFIPGLDLFGYFYTNFLQLFFYQLLLGISIGSLSSFFAVRRYLRN